LLLPVGFQIKDYFLRSIYDWSLFICCPLCLQAAMVWIFRIRIALDWHWQRIYPSSAGRDVAQIFFFFRSRYLGNIVCFNLYVMCDPSVSQSKQERKEMVRCRSGCQPAWI